MHSYYSTLHVISQASLESKWLSEGGTGRAETPFLMDSSSADAPNGVLFTVPAFSSCDNIVSSPAVYPVLGGLLDVTEPVSSTTEDDVDPSSSRRVSSFVFPILNGNSSSKSDAVHTNLSNLTDVTSNSCCAKSEENSVSASRVFSTCSQSARSVESSNDDSPSVVNDFISVNIAHRSSALNATPNTESESLDLDQIFSAIVHPDANSDLRTLSGLEITPTKEEPAEHSYCRSPMPDPFCPYQHSSALQCDPRSNLTSHQSCGKYCLILTLFLLLAIVHSSL